MKQRIITIWCTLACLLLTPALSLGAEGVVYNAKLEGYQGAKLDDASTALTWLLFIGLTMLAVAVMFKNAKRSHLD